MRATQHLTLKACECFVLSSLFHLILRSVAKRSVSKDGNAKNGAAGIMRCICTVPVATLRDTPLRSVPQGEVGVQPSAERFAISEELGDAARWAAPQGEVIGSNQNLNCRRES
jgi:hypothetical protein